MGHPPFERNLKPREEMPRITESHLGIVTSVQDPAGMGRVKVRMFSFDGPTDQDGQIWARVATPLAGLRRGAYLIPDVDDEVLVTFVGGDPRMPVVVGSLWNGQNVPIAGHSSTRGIDRWVFQSKDGTVVKVTEEQTGQAVIHMSVPQGTVSAELRQAGGGVLELRAAGSTITIDSGGVTITAPGECSVEASTISMTAGMVTVDSALAQFSGIVQATTVKADAIVGTLYTPGAGNIW